MCPPFRREGLRVRQTSREWLFWCDSDLTRCVSMAPASPGEFAEKNEGCEARSRENAGIARSIVKGLRDHRFRRHGDERPRSVRLEDCHRMRAKVTQQVKGKSRRHRSTERVTAP